MATFGEIKQFVLKALGGRNDAATVAIVNDSVNMAIEVVALAYDVPEIHVNEDVSFAGGQSERSLDSAMRLIDIVEVYNKTHGNRMFFVPLNRIDLVAPTKNVPTFYTRDGNNLIVKPAPSTLTTFNVRYTQFPAKLTDDDASIPFEGHLAAVIAVATTLAWAAFEEPESAEVWLKIAQVLNVPYQKAELARRTIWEQPSENLNVK